ncbi:GTPase Era, partial [Chloroflexota bacterium]
MNDLETVNIPDPLDDTPEGHRSGFVAVIGRPNVGKSTLMNALLGQKIAIVSNKPQTTRVQQLGILTTDDAQIIFVDTPGLHKPRHELGKFMVDVAGQALSDADMIMFVVEGNHLPGTGDRMITEQLKRSATDTPILLVINKIDITTPDYLQKSADAYQQLVSPIDWLALSAHKGTGIDDLRKRLYELLPEGPRYYPADQVTETYTRAIVAEIVREKVLRNTRDEIPHAIAVEVTEFKERENGVTYIASTIYVERESQKRIIIGKSGQMLKKVGAQARPEIEGLVDGRVYLELWVKVLSDWRR